MTKESKPTKVVSEDGTERWYLNGVRHRLEGPAVIHPNGHEEWWAFGQHLEPPGPCPICGALGATLTTEPPGLSL